MSSVVISGDSSGTVTLTVPSAAGTNTATLPAATGTVMVSGNQPAFSAYKNGGTQPVSSNTWTKVSFQAEDFDTNNCFDSTTNYRFTPTVSGYYQLTAGLDLNVNGTVSLVAIYKNGTLHKYIGCFWSYSSQTWETQMSGSTLVSANGTTDYFEVYVKLTGTSTNIYSDQTTTFFQGSLVRTS